VNQYQPKAMPAISSRAPPTAATISRRRRRFSRASGSSAGSGGSAWRRSASRSFGGSVSRGLFSGGLSSRDGETRHASACGRSARSLGGAAQLGPNPSSSLSGRSLVGMRYEAFSQLPKSTSLQRAEQNGPSGSAKYSFSLPQIGQAIRVDLAMGYDTRI